MNHDLEAIAATLVAPGKGILAADETVPTLTKRFDTLGIQSTEESRRTYREMLFTAAGVEETISGAIMYDETIRQRSTEGTPLPQVLASHGIVPGIKVDTGAKPLAGSPGETVTEGLDGLRDRLAAYHAMGARFAKWRAVFRIADELPSQARVIANAHALGRYAALCQEQHLVPIVEPEVLMDGDHSIERCEEVTGAVLHAVFGKVLRWKACCSSPIWLCLARSPPPLRCKRWRSPLSAASVDTCRWQCRGLCSCLVVRRNGLQQPT
jgi:fructose-bisphosphate aldolase class I